MILYDTVCTPCARKQLWQELRNFARINKLSLKRIDIKKQPEYAEKALSYEVEPPFVVHHGVALSLTEPMEKLL